MGYFQQKNTAKTSAQQPAPQSVEETCDTLFQLLDKNSDSWVDEREMKRFFRKMCGLSKPEAKTWAKLMLESITSSQDGKISRDEVRPCF